MLYSTYETGYLDAAVDAEFGWLNCWVKKQPSSWEFARKQCVDRLVILRVLLVPFTNKL